MNVSHPFFLVILLIFFAACSSDSSDPDVPSDQQDQDQSDPIMSDDQAPVINITGIEDIIETFTTLQVNVTDNSEVETRILVNDQEIFATMDKQFEYELNPFNIPVGIIDLKIISEDILGNSSESEFGPEIKHLLMEFNMGESELNQFDNAWAFFNSASGELLATMALSQGINKIYTEALIPEDHIYYTLTKYITYGTNVVHTLSSESYKLSPGQTRNESELLIADRDEEVEIEIIRDDLVNEWSKYTSIGSQYGPISYSFTSAPSYSEIYSISYAYPEIVFIRTAIANAGEGLDGKKENYRYTTIQPNPGMSNIQVVEANFKAMDDHFEQPVPPHDLHSFRFDRHGFENQADMLANRNHLIYSLSEGANAITMNEIDVPILPDLSLYNNIAQYFLDGNRIYIRQFGNSLNLQAPVWDLNSYGSNGSDYFIDADNEEVDYYLIRLSKSSGTSGPSKSFVWVYRTFGSEDEDLTTPQLEFPEEITNSIGDAFYSAENIAPEYAVAVDFEELNSFQEAMDYFATGSLMLETDEQSIKSVRFSQSATTGKLQHQPMGDLESRETHY